MAQISLFGASPRRGCTGWSEILPLAAGGWISPISIDDGSRTDSRYLIHTNQNHHLDRDIALFRDRMSRKRSWLSRLAGVPLVVFWVLTALIFPEAAIAPSIHHQLPQPITAVLDRVVLIPITLMPDRSRKARKGSALEPPKADDLTEPFLFHEDEVQGLGPWWGSGRSPDLA